MSDGNCNTRLLHNGPVGLVLRGSIFYYRRRVPHDIRAIVGRAELWKSLRTDSKAQAIRRLPTIAAKVESEFEFLRHKAGLTIDHTLLDLFNDGSTLCSSPNTEVSEVNGSGAYPTLGDVYRRYMDDPTNAWTGTTRQAYQTTPRAGCFSSRC